MPEQESIASRHPWTSFGAVALAASGVALVVAAWASDRPAHLPALQSVQGWAARLFVLALAFQVLIHLRLTWLNLTTGPAPRFDTRQARKRLWWALGSAPLSNIWMIFFAGSPEGRAFELPFLHEQWLTGVMFGVLTIGMVDTIMTTRFDGPISRSQGRWGLAILVPALALLGLIVWFGWTAIVLQFCVPLIYGWALIESARSVFRWGRREIDLDALPPGLSSHRGLRRSVVACGAIERLLPPRLAREELGDALERAVALARAGAPSWRIDALWVTAIAIAVGNSLRELPLWSSGRRRRGR